MRIFTEHARRRIQQGGIAEDDIHLAIHQGIRLNRTGVTFYFLGRRQTRRLRGRGDRLNGLTVLQADDGQIITAYKNRKGLRTIKRKCSWDLRRRAVFRG